MVLCEWMNCLRLNRRGVSLDHEDGNSGQGDGGVHARYGHRGEGLEDYGVPPSPLRGIAKRPKTARQRQRAKKGAWISVTVTLQTDMVRWPGNPAVQVLRVLNLNRSDECRLMTLSLGVHSSTHLDAPLHFLRTGLGIDAMPVSAGVGRTGVIAIKSGAVSASSAQHVTHPEAGRRTDFSRILSRSAMQQHAGWWIDVCARSPSIIRLSRGTSRTWRRSIQSCSREAFGSSRA
ncbi:MAG: cyclase family protein [Nitrospira sp.]